MATKVKPKTSLKIKKTVVVRQIHDIQADEIARDMVLMDQLEALVQSLPDRRAEAGLPPLSDDAVASSYDEREAQLL